MNVVEVVVEVHAWEGSNLSRAQAAVLLRVTRGRLHGTKPMQQQGRGGIRRNFPRRRRVGKTILSTTRGAKVTAEM